MSNQFECAMCGADCWKGNLCSKCHIIKENNYKKEHNITACINCADDPCSCGYEEENTCEICGDNPCTCILDELNDEFSGMNLEQYAGYVADGIMSMDDIIKMDHTTDADIREIKKISDLKMKKDEVELKEIRVINKKKKKEKKESDAQLKECGACFKNKKRIDFLKETANSVKYCVLCKECRDRNKIYTDRWRQGGSKKIKGATQDAFIKGRGANKQVLRNIITFLVQKNITLKNKILDPTFEIIKRKRGDEYKKGDYWRGIFKGDSDEEIALFLKFLNPEKRFSSDNYKRFQ